MRKLIKGIVALSLIITACDDSNTKEQNLFNPIISPLKQDIKVGLYPNRIVTDGDSVYVVNSGDNTVGKLNLTTYEYDNNFIKLDVGYNPYSLSLKDSHLYISTSGKIDAEYKADDVIIDVDLNTGSKTEILSSLFMASDLISSSCVEFVESEYDYTNGVANGKFTRYCTDSTVSIPTTCKNPTRVVDNKDEYIVTCSGVYQYDSDYNIVGTDGSGVCFYNYNLEETSCILSNKDTGTPAVGSTTSLIGSTYSGIITILKDSEQDTVTLAEGSMLVPIHLKDDTYVVAGFNNSTLYVYNSLTKEIITEYKMRKTDLDKRGPLDLLYIKDKSQLVVLNSLSATIDIFTID